MKIFSTPEEWISECLITKHPQYSLAYDLLKKVTKKIEEMKQDCMTNLFHFCTYEYDSPEASDFFIQYYYDGREGDIVFDFEERNLVVTYDNWKGEPIEFIIKTIDEIDDLFDELQEEIKKVEKEENKFGYHFAVYIAQYIHQEFMNDYRLYDFIYNELLKSNTHHEIEEVMSLYHPPYRIDADSAVLFNIMGHLFIFEVSTDGWLDEYTPVREIKNIWSFPLVQFNESIVKLKSLIKEDFNYVNLKIEIERLKDHLML